MEPHNNFSPQSCHIGIELVQLQPGASGGLVQLLVGVLNELFDLAADHPITVFARFPANEFFGQLPASVNWVTAAGRVPLDSMDDQLFERQVDVLLRCFPLEQPIYFPLAKQVVVVPDLQHEHLPELFDGETLRRRHQAFRQAARGAGKLAVISEHGRLELESFYPEAKGRTFLMSPALPEPVDRHRPGARPPQGADPIQHTTGELPTSPYFLFPANLWPHKNHPRLLQALQRFNHTAAQPHALVLTGSQEGWCELRAQFPELPVHHLGYVDASTLGSLYRHAVALTNFSLYEGFGIPLLEAFHYGTPVLCSRTTSLPEVGGDAVLTCDPTDVEAMAAIMSRIVNEKGLAARLVDRGKRRLQDFSWKDSATALLGALRQVAANGTTPAMAELACQLNAFRQRYRDLQNLVDKQNDNLRTSHNRLLEYHNLLLDQLQEHRCVHKAAESMREEFANMRFAFEDHILRSRNRGFPGLIRRILRTADKS